MAALFFDSSGVVKRYVAEAGSAWVNRQFALVGEHRFYLSRILGVEVVSAVARRRLAGTLPEPIAEMLLRQFRAEFHGVFRVVELGSGLLDQAMNLADEQHLRAIDAVQLATALDLDRRRQGRGLRALTLVSRDQELNAAAARRGLAVVDPVFEQET